MPAKSATQTAGLIGCTLLGAAAAGIAMSGAKIDGLLNSSVSVTDSRRSSTPNTSIGSSFSSIFSLKSPMSSKSPATVPPPAAAAIIAPSTSNFYVPQPVAETVVVSSQTEQLKTVQGIN